jgi:nickel/cobalt transporter (NiCoT) family protein
MLSKFTLQLMFLLLIIFSIAITVFLHSKTLMSIGVIAFSLGLRHGFDADRIVAIDNVTRKLAYENKASITTGFFFAIGHSTIVFF